MNHPELEAVIDRFLATERSLQTDILVRLAIHSEIAVQFYAASAGITLPEAEGRVAEQAACVHREFKRRRR